MKMIDKYIAKENYKEALVEIEKILKNNSNDFQILTRLVLILIGLKNFSKAEENIITIENIYHKNPYLEFLRAKNFFEQNQFKLSVNVLENALDYFGTNISKQCLALYYELLTSSYRYLRENKKFIEVSQKASLLADDITIKANKYGNSLFYSNYEIDLGDEELFKLHIKYDDIFCNIEKFEHTHKNMSKKIRIAYLSADFKYHVVVFFVYNLLSQYNKNMFEVYCYFRGSADEITEDLKLKVDVWNDVKNMTDEEIAKKIYCDEIDILFDLAGHAGVSLPILARKPAPIQICGIGYFNTTGLKTVDYFLTDINCDPIGKNDDIFTEKLIRLPDSHFCYVPPDTMPNINYNNGNIVFGSFNNFNKINKDVLKIWLDIIKKVDNSKLILKSADLDNKYSEYKIIDMLNSVGFNKEQVEIRKASLNYLKEYNEIDIALDTWPYPGGGTTCEALYMGVPVITLVGERHGSRFGYSILKNIGLVEGIAFSKEEYVEKAVALAQNKERLSMLHLSLRQMMENSPLMDGKLYMTVLEEQYQKIWQQYLEREKDVIMNNAIEEKYYHNLYLYISKDKDLDCERVLMQAFCLLKLKQYEQAETLIEKVVAIDPLYFDAYLLLAEIYIDQGKEVEEQEIISTVLTWFENKGLTVLDSKEMKQYQEFKDRLKI